jgi:DNA-binding IclR family transcriptional regulator
MELSDLSGLHVATAHRILQALVIEGFLSQEAATGKYHLGLNLLRLGEVSKISNDIYRVSYPWVKKLAEQWGETVILDTIVAKFDVARVLVVPSTHLISSNPEYYKTVPPLHSFAAGKVILAHNSEQDINEYFRNFPPSFSDKVFDELKQIKLQGFSTNFGEPEEDFMALSAPVRNINGKVIAALDLGGPSSRINGETFPAILKSVLETCKNISTDLGYSELLEGGTR